MSASGSNGTSNGQLHPPVPASEQKQLAELTSKPRTLGYVPSLPIAALMGVNNTLLPYWRVLWDVELMLQHPQVQHCLRIYKGAIWPAEFEIRTGKSEWGEFVHDFLHSFWSRSLEQAQLVYHFGRAGFEACYKEENGLLRYDKILEFARMDVNPLTQDNELVGIRVHNADKGRTLDLWSAQPGLPAKGVWLTHNKHYHRWHGLTQLLGAWRPWRRLAFRDGAEEILDGAMYRRGYGGFLVKAPPGSTQAKRQPPNADQRIDNFDVAEEMAIGMKAGASGVVSSEVWPEGGKPKWEVVPMVPDLTNIGGLLEYKKELWDEIAFGIGTPPELSEASDTGSGYSGRAIPKESFFISQQFNAENFVQSALEQMGVPLLQWNFGPEAWAKVRVKPLLKSQVQQAGGQGPPGQPPEQVSPPSGQPPGGGGKPNLSDLLGGQQTLSLNLGGDTITWLSAAPRPQPDNGANTKDDLRRAVLAAMIDIALEAQEKNDPDSAEQILQELAELASEAGLGDFGKTLQQVQRMGLSEAEGLQYLAWVADGQSRFGTPRWRNTESGRRAYQKMRPGQAREDRAKAAEIARGHLERIHGQQTVSHEHLLELALHIAALTVPELRQFKSLLGGWRRGPRKEGLVASVKEYARKAVEQQRLSEERNTAQEAAAEQAPSLAEHYHNLREEYRQANQQVYDLTTSDDEGAFQAAMQKRRKIVEQLNSVADQIPPGKVREMVKNERQKPEGGAEHVPVVQPTGPGEQSAAWTPAGFRDVAEADKWGKQHFAEWAKGLTKDERWAVEAYSGGGFSEINPHLRGGRPLEESKGKTRQVVEGVDAALAKGLAPENLTAYRGVRGEGQADNVVAKLVELSKTGGVLRDPAFLSSSLSPTLPEKAFSKVRPGVDTAILSINVPKGSPGAYTDALDIAGEAEWLSPRNSGLRVKSAKQRPDGMWQIDAEYVPPTARMPPASVPEAPTPSGPHFTGTLTDALGREYRFEDGVRVGGPGDPAAAKPKEPTAEPEKPAEQPAPAVAEPPAARPEPKRVKVRGPRKSRATEVETLADAVRHHGGLNVDKTRNDFSITGDFKEHGLLHLFSKKPQAHSIDEMADTLVKAGVLIVPPDRNADDYLVEKLQSGAASALKNYDKWAEEASRRYEEELANVRASESEADVAEAVRAGEAEADAAIEAGTDEEPAGDLQGEEVGDTSFDFGANEAEEPAPTEEPARDLFGNPVPKQFGKIPGAQQSAFAGHPDIPGSSGAWMDRAKEFAAEHGGKVEGFEAGNRVKIDGKWYQGKMSEKGEWNFAEHDQPEHFTGTDALGREWRNGELVAKPPEPGFTGIDAQGREWRDGKLVHKPEESGEAARNLLDAGAKPGTMPAAQETEASHERQLEEPGSEGRRGGLPVGQPVGAVAEAPPGAELPGVGAGVGVGPGAVPAGAGEPGDESGRPAGAKRRRARGGPRDGAGGVAAGAVGAGGAVGDGGGAGDSGSGGVAATAGEQSLAEEPTAENPTDLSAGNFRYADRDFVAGGLKAKFRANLDAIRTLQTIQAEGRR